MTGAAAFKTNREYNLAHDFNKLHRITRIQQNNGCKMKCKWEWGQCAHRKQTKQYPTLNLAAKALQLRILNLKITDLKYKINPIFLTHDFQN